MSRWPEPTESLPGTRPARANWKNVENILGSRDFLKEIIPSSIEPGRNGVRMLSVVNRDGLVEILKRVLDEPAPLLPRSSQMSAKMSRNTRGLVMLVGMLVSLTCGAPAARGQTGPRQSGVDASPQGLTSALDSVARFVDKASVEVLSTSAASGDRVARRRMDRAGQRPDRSDGRPASWMKKTFKDFRPGSCRSLLRAAPTSSWPDRTEPAVSFCQS
jgi:hypothetical protein